MFGYLRLAKWAGVVAIVAAIGLYVWTAERAKERAAAYKAQLDVATETAEHNAEVARFLRADAKHTNALLAKRERERARLARETEALRGRLRDALQDASDEVQECLPVRLPDAVLDSLYDTETDPEG